MLEILLDMLIRGDADGPDYTLNNPDTLTKYKTAAQISHKVLEAVSGGFPGITARQNNRH